MGAIGEDGVRILNDDVVQATGVTDAEIAAVETRERVELERRARCYRGERPRAALEGRTAVVVDDGIATGSTARAACQVARARGAARVVLAVPVAPPGWQARIGNDADEFVSLATPDIFFAIGQYYVEFSDTSDEEVVRCLERAARQASSLTEQDRQRRPGSDDPLSHDEEVVVEAGAIRLGGHLTVPEHAIGLVMFAHGSGSSRHSQRNRYVAGVLHRAAIGTLLFDLLTEAEERDRWNVFDVGLLAGRLVAATEWVRAEPAVAGLPVGYFGASTGAAAALWAAAELGPDVTAVVSRGGRPDLAGARLAEVTAPTLFIVGGSDDVVLELNQQAASNLRCENRLVVVAGATHLFEEPGTLQTASEAARDWFKSRFLRSHHRLG
jgi:putative phosphoribosyl transferase